MIDILILFFNKVDQTISCINSFLPSGQHVYVLNNGSDEQQLKKLQQTFRSNEQVHILDGGKNLGVSSGRNYLIRQTTEEWLFSVDNDITISPAENWLKFFNDYTVENPGAQIICPHIFNVHENEYALQLQVEMKGNEVSLQTGSFETTNCFPGGASIIHRSVFEQYGLFDDDMFVGFEDYEYAVRAMLSGKGMLQAHHIKNIELIHDHQFQKSTKDKEAVRQRYNEEKLKTSYDRMINKYNIVFEHNWEWWTRNQVMVMTEKPWISRMKRLLKRLSG